MFENSLASEALAPSPLETRTEAQGLGGVHDTSEREMAPVGLLKRNGDGSKRKTTIIAITLNKRWAVTADSRQWMVSEWKGDEWRPMKFTYDRDHLLDLIREHCLPVKAEELIEIGRWPERHSTWWRILTGKPTPSIAYAASLYG